MAVAFEALDRITRPGKGQFLVSLRRVGSRDGAGAGEEVVRRVTSSPDFEWVPERPGRHVLEVQAIGQHLVYSSPVRVPLEVFVPWHEKTAWRVAGGGGAMVVLLGAAGLLAANLAHRREARRMKDRMIEQERSARVAMEEKNRQLERGTAELRENQRKLEEALANVKTLRGLVPICAACKKIRDDHGFWQQLESYVQTHSEARFSHGMCPECMEKWYPEDPRQED